MSLAEPDGYDQVRTIVCDLDGVLYVDSEPVPGAGEALERLQSDGYDLLFVTNNATRTPAMVVANIAQRT
ncbi:MAG: TIGR01458 family HAD-type hydrolase, partial [Acidobacteria bacterium]|nr:TIGR01458 family HAD-type hydrolase [Acidobacteriota bacterium]